MESYCGSYGGHRWDQRPQSLQETGLCAPARAGMAVAAGPADLDAVL